MHMCCATWRSQGAQHIFPSGSAWAGSATRPRRSGGGDGCRAERDEVEREEDELQAQLDREDEEAQEEERWLRMGMVGNAMFETWGEDD